ncbi:MAG: hypothetical protein ABR577_00660 [Pyrinomonadaceae bacterium]
MKERKQSTKEYKKVAARLVAGQGRTISAAAQNSGVTVSTLIGEQQLKVTFR